MEDDHLSVGRFLNVDFDVIGPVFDRLRASTGAVLGWPDAYAFALVATGRADVAVDAGVAAWDVAPFAVILEEAGGRFTDWEGVPTIHGKSGVAANPRLHGQLMEILGDPTL